MHTEASPPAPCSSFGARIIRWPSLHAYGLVMRSLFRAQTPPHVMRRRFERFGRTSRIAVVLVGEDEMLAAETHRWVARARDAGTDARLLVGARMQHDWPLTLPWLAESRRAWAEIAEFVERSDNPPHGRSRTAPEGAAHDRRDP